MQSLDVCTLLTYLYLELQLVRLIILAQLEGRASPPLGPQHRQVAEWKNANTDTGLAQGRCEREWRHWGIVVEEHGPPPIPFPPTFPIGQLLAGTG